MNVNRIRARGYRLKSNLKKLGLPHTVKIGKEWKSLGTHGMIINIYKDDELVYEIQNQESAHTLSLVFKVYGNKRIPVINEFNESEYSYEYDECYGDFEHIPCEDNLPCTIAGERVEFDGMAQIAFGIYLYEEKALLMHKALHVLSSPNFC